MGGAGKEDIDNVGREALILASIIERETGVEAERAEVSGVFHNRLRRRWTDPTRRLPMP